MMFDERKVQYLRRDDEAYIPEPQSLQSIVAVAAYGSEGEVAAARDRLMRIGADTGGRYLGEELSELDWASRHDRYATPLHGRSRDRAVHMSWHCEDAAITYSQLPFVKRRWHEIADRYIAEHEVFDNWGMFFYTNNAYKGWGDFLVEIDIGIWEQRLDEWSWRAWTDLKREITQVSLDAGGSISACHGATREGEVELVPAELGGQFDLMLKLKRMLDPNNIMNPGKYLLDQAYEDGGVRGTPTGCPGGWGGLSMPDELPPGVVDNDGHYEVDPALMSIYPQFATDFEVDRIIKDRLEYLYWVQRHFADRVLPPRAEDAPGLEGG